MKKLLIASLLVAGSFTTSAASANTHIAPSLEQDLVKICKALKSNSKLKLHNVIKKSGLKYKNIANGLVCNGHDALQFAVINGANKTAGLLARKANVDLDSYVAKR